MTPPTAAAAPPTTTPKCRGEANPHEVLLVADIRTGQDAVRTGIVLTRVEADVSAAAKRLS